MSNLKLLSVVLFLISIILLSNPFFVEAQEKPSSIEERLIRLEVGQKALNQRIDDFRQDTNTRFAAIDKRFDDINNRFDDLQFWLQLTFGAIVLVIAGIIAQWLLMWRKLIKIETKVEEHLAETEKDRLITFQREEIEMLKSRLDKLEAGTI